MNYRVVEEKRISGGETTIYSIQLEGQNSTEFVRFIENHKELFKEEVKDIYARLVIIGREVGAREIYFKKEEGLPGDLVCALYDQPDSNLRLYCIRYGKCAIILGNGGHKPKATTAWQDKPDLESAAKQMIKVSEDIYKRLRDGELNWSIDGSYLVGDLEFNDYEDE